MLDGSMPNACSSATVASATVAARLGLECVVYMGEVDVARQEANVFRMRLLGAEVRAVSSGSRTLKDALNEAMRVSRAAPLVTPGLSGAPKVATPLPAWIRKASACPW